MSGEKLCPLCDRPMSRHPFADCFIRPETGEREASLRAALEIPPDVAQEPMRKIICPRCRYDTGHYDLRPQLESALHPHQDVERLLREWLDARDAYRTHIEPGTQSFMEAVTRCVQAERACLAALTPNEGEEPNDE